MPFFIFFTLQLLYLFKIHHSLFLLELRSETRDQPGQIPCLVCTNLANKADFDSDDTYLANDEHSYLHQQLALVCSSHVVLPCSCSCSECLPPLKLSRLCLAQLHSNCLPYCPCCPPPHSSSPPPSDATNSHPPLTCGLVFLLDGSTECSS